MEKKKKKERNHRAGEMTQQLGALTAFPEVLSSIPSNQKKKKKSLCTAHSMDLDK
jgi:hypothetical protein